MSAWECRLEQTAPFRESRLRWTCCVDRGIGVGPLRSEQLCDQTDPIDNGRGAITSERGSGGFDKGARATFWPD